MTDTDTLKDWLLSQGTQKHAQLSTRYKKFLFEEALSQFVPKVQTYLQTGEGDTQEIANFIPNHSQNFQNYLDEVVFLSGDIFTKLFFYQPLSHSVRPDIYSNSSDKKSDMGFLLWGQLLKTNPAHHSNFFKAMTEYVFQAQSRELTRSFLPAPAFSDYGIAYTTLAAQQLISFAKEQHSLNHMVFQPTLRREVENSLIIYLQKIYDRSFHDYTPESQTRALKSVLDFQQKLVELVHFATERDNTPKGRKENVQIFHNKLTRSISTNPKFAVALEKLLLTQEIGVPNATVVRPTHKI